MRREKSMGHFLKRVLLINGLMDLCIGIGLVLFPDGLTGLLGFPDFPGSASFLAGGWGVAALALGFGRVTASWDPKKWRLWSLLGLLEGGLLAALCLGYWLRGVLDLTQIGVPLVIGTVLALCYAASYPSLRLIVRPRD
jgi:hypothetical protein